MLKSILKTVFAVFIVVGCIYFVAYNETHYSKMGTVTQHGLISTFVDHRGNQYDFYTDEKIPANASVKARFFTNNTIDNIYDDMLIGYELIGHVDKIEIDF